MRRGSCQFGSEDTYSPNPYPGPTWPGEATAAGLVPWGRHLNILSFWKRWAGKAEAPCPEEESAARQQVERALDEQISHCFDQVFGDDEDPTPVATDDVETTSHAGVRELFAEIAAQHASPVKNFIFELRRGTATREWIEICQPVVRTLVEGAASMNLHDISAATGRLADALRSAAADEDNDLSGATRDRILDAYQSVCGVLPTAFAMGDDVERRENVIIHSLLKQIPGVGHVTFERLYGAGLASVSVLYGASPEELSATTGITPKLSRAICNRIGAHLRDIGAQPRGKRHDRLARLLSHLRREHERFELAAARHWIDEDMAAQKRESRQERQRYALQIDVVLAEMGELDLIEALQRMPVGRRIEVIEEFLRREESLAMPVEDRPTSSGLDARG